MERVRPYIPIPIRVQVAIRQLHAAGKYAMRIEAGPTSWVLASNLRLLFGEGIKVHLDHNPALRLRQYNPRIKDAAARYTPNANDPDYLIYRTANDHHIKTNVRGDGAQFSDTVLRKRERRRQRKSVKSAKVMRKLCRPIPQRPNPWPTGRKFQSRP